jgi:hypothetical protein
MAVALQLSARAGAHVPDGGNVAGAPSLASEGWLLTPCPEGEPHGDRDWLVELMIYRSELARRAICAGVTSTSPNAPL